MSSVVYYRFRSSRQPLRLAFDGTGISVFDLKRGILLANKLDATADSFVLKLANPDTHESYDDDSEVVPRSTSVEVRRLPVARPGSHDSAAKYVSGTLVVNAKNAARREDFSGKAGLPQMEEGVAYYPVSGGSGANTEEDMMNAMFASQGAQWSRTQQEMASKTPVYIPRQAVAASQEPDKTLPPGYICHRCGQKGHWITQCPSLYDPNWETKKVRRTTGIPKAMLRTVEKPADDDDGKTYLMNADGEYVVAVADDKSWADFQSRQQQQQARAQRAVPEELKDPITHELMRDPRKMPCCGTTYADESIENALIQSDFKCPHCGKEEVYIDQLEVDTDMTNRLRDFVSSSAAPSETASVGPESSKSPASSSQPSLQSSAEPSLEPTPAFESDDSDYEPDASFSPDTVASPASRKRRRSSVESVGSPESEPEPAAVPTQPLAAGAVNGMMNAPMMNPMMMNPMMNPMMMPFGFNPFMMPMAANGGPAAASEASKNDEFGDVAIADDKFGDDQAVVGRIR